MELVLSAEASVAEFDSRAAAFLDALESGAVRAAWPDASAPGGWRVEAWVKQAILAIFARSANVEGCGAAPGGLPFRDRGLLLPKRVLPTGVRMVPGGSAVRRGAHLGVGVIVMPPAYVNVGAFVGEGSLIDSHALVGSCAQIGKRVHLSAAAQIGGVLEPVGALPVIVEDEVFVGGGVGLFAGVVVGRGAVLGAGVVLTGSSRVFDLVREEIIEAKNGSPLVIPAGAVVVPGTRPAAGRFAAAHGLALSTPILVKQRDASTDARTALAEVLRA
ncbi:MAG: 2,3,4,5-tetrahydropyridine-2,6-dicarboxylate N-succinyltransferase [Acidobacteriota bacterium]